MILKAAGMPNSETLWTMTYHVPADPMSDSSVNLVKDWIGDCVSSHEVCMTSAFTGALPSRVIDSGSPNSTEEPRLLPTSTNSGLSNKYATLSHCSGQVERTATSNNSLAKIK